MSRGQLHFMQIARYCCIMDLMIKKKETQKEYALPKWFWAILIGAGVIVIILVGWLLFYRTGWPGYLYALNECDGKPPIRVSSFIANRYIAPGDESYRIPGGWGLSTGYYCSEAEAIDAGYTRAN